MYPDFGAKRKQISSVESATEKSSVLGTATEHFFLPLFFVSRGNTLSSFLCRIYVVSYQIPKNNKI